MVLVARCACGGNVPAGKRSFQRAPAHHERGISTGICLLVQGRTCAHSTWRPDAPPAAVSCAIGDPAARWSFAFLCVSSSAGLSARFFVSCATSSLLPKRQTTGLHEHTTHTSAAPGLSSRPAPSSVCTQSGCETFLGQIAAGLFWRAPRPLRLPSWNAAPKAPSDSCCPALWQLPQLPPPSKTAKGA